MDLIDDLENDLALAFLVEKKHKQKIDSREALELMGKIKDALEPDTDEESINPAAPASEKTIKAVSH